MQRLQFFEIREDCYYGLPRTAPPQGRHYKQPSTNVNYATEFFVTLGQLLAIKGLPLVSLNPRILFYNCIKTKAIPVTSREGP
jgi:hypothetical protein